MVTMYNDNGPSSSWRFFKKINRVETRLTRLVACKFFLFYLNNDFLHIDCVYHYYLNDQTMDSNDDSHPLRNGFFKIDLTGSRRIYLGF